jgi:tetratricopeptide (TPR) repeat protein
MAANALSSVASAIEMEVKRIRALMEQGQFAAALAAAESLLAEVPENRDVLYMIAVSERYLGRIADALSTLDRLEALHPAYSRLFQERGHCHVALREAEPAIAAYLRAVNLNHALPASWSALQKLLRMAGRATDAEMAASHVAALAKLPTEIVTASSMFADGEIHPAEAIVRQYLLKHGNHVEAMRLLAKIGMQHGVLDDAELLLESVLVLAPDYQAARYDYARTLLDRQSYVKARQELDKLLEVEPRNRSYRTAYATASVGLGEPERGIELYRELLAEAPAADLHLSIAHALKTLGKRDEAIDAYRQAIALRPAYGDAYWSLANLKTYRFDDAQIACMRLEEAARTTPLVDRYHLCFALGKALEDRAEYAESFRFYERGNALKKSEIRYRPGPIARNARLQASVCTRSSSRHAGASAARAPIRFSSSACRDPARRCSSRFSPRIPSRGHDGTGEITRLVNALRGRELDRGAIRDTRAFSELAPADFRDWVKNILADTRVYRRQAVFIDKMPNNFRHIGLIHLILPNAKIIDARRAPVACCFSNFKQLFASGQEFTYDLEDIARYYRDYLELMAHWERALPGKVLRVQHEQVVEDLEGNVRRLLDFCGLEFEPACLEFYKTERSVRTASSEQVRQPIYRDGIDQWRHFEPWLGSRHVV